MMLLLTPLMLLLTCCRYACGISNSSYLSNEALNAFIKETAGKYPDMAHVYSIGTTLQGRELLVIALSATRPDKHLLLRPETKYVGNMHGNEAVSREVLARFVQHMLEGYGRDPAITSLMNTSRVHVMPTMNPDGFAASVEGTCHGIRGRQNHKMMDLNRDFPDVFDPKYRTRVTMQPESLAIVNWVAVQQFVLSANFHGGAMVVNYPYDSVKNPDSWSRSGTPNICEDDDTFQFLAKKYSYAHRTLRQSSCLPRFKDGITNGAYWYIALGGMQDYHYVRAGCMEITIEMSCCKYPRFDEIETYWLDNKVALTSYLEQVNIGVKGVVSTNDGQSVSDAEVKVDSRMVVKTTTLGEYWKLLLPGNYTLNVVLRGRVLASVPITVPQTGVSVYNITLSSNMSSLVEPKVSTKVYDCDAGNLAMSTSYSAYSALICVVCLLYSLIQY